MLIATVVSVLALLVGLVCLILYPFAARKQQQRLAQIRLEKAEHAKKLAQAEKRLITRFRGK